METKTFWNKLRDKIIIGGVEWTKPFYIRWFKKNVAAWKYNKTSLLQFPKGTLGKALGDFLDQKQLELMPKAEDHDVYHVLLDFETDAVGEVQMQFFLLGNRKRSLYSLIAALVGLLITPEYISVFWKAFKKGRNSLSISTWNFQHLLNEPVDVLKNQIFKRAMPEEAPLFI